MMAQPDRELPIQVGIGLVRRGTRYLIRQRPEPSPMAGCWEFPGGKVEAGETIEGATSRECLEEIGVAVVVGPLVRHVVHRYAHGLLSLSYHECETIDPWAEPEAGSGFVWVEAADLPGYPFPEANDELVASLARS